MASKEVFSSADGIRLYGGLDWRLLESSEKVDSAVRATAKQLSASYFTLCSSSVKESRQQGKKVVVSSRQSGGFFFSSTDEVPSKKTHSLASAFAVWASAHRRAVLVEQLTSDSFAVVVVIDGLPVQDRVLSTVEEAVDLVNTYTDDDSTTIFSLDTVRFPFAHPIDQIFVEIASICTRETRIRAVPENVMMIGVLVLVVCAVAGGYYALNSYKKDQERKAAAARVAEENPIPKYLAGLELQRSSLGFDRKSLVAVFNSISQDKASALPLQPRGWNLRSVTCGRTPELLEAGCSAKFERTYGTFEDIRQALPQFKLKNPPDSMNLDRAEMTWTPVFKPEAIALEAGTLDEFVRGVTGSQFQIWLLAGIQLRVQQPSLWPKVAGVPNSFKHPKALAVGDFSLTGVSLPLVAEAIRSAPANVIFSSWKMDIEVPKKNSEPLQDAKVSLNGIFYVKN